MTKGSVIMSKCIFLAVILAFYVISASLSSCEEILLHTQQPYKISDNRTLVAEDVDPSAGVVWLKLYSNNGTLKSAILGVGDHFGYDNMNLTVSKIYAGGEMDLVELLANNSSAVDRSMHWDTYSANNTHSAKISANSSHNTSSNLALNISGGSTDPERSPGFGLSAIPMIVIAYGFINKCREGNK